MESKDAICNDCERLKSFFCETCGFCSGCCCCADFDADDDYASTPHPSAYYEESDVNL